MHIRLEEALPSHRKAEGSSRARIAPRRLQASAAGRAYSGRVTPTRPRLLVLIALVAGVIGWALATLAAPCYIGFATEQLGLASDVAVSRLLLMQTLGSVAGALAFSRYGDQRSVQFMAGTLVFAIAQPVLALVASVTGPAPLYAAFLMGGVALGCLGVSFINWVILYATPDQRPVYSGLFNSMSAVGLLVAPLIGGTLVELVSYEAAFAAALLFLAGALAVFLHQGATLRAA